MLMMTFGKCGWHTFACGQQDSLMWCSNVWVICINNVVLYGPLVLDELTLLRKQEAKVKE